MAAHPRLLVDLAVVLGDIPLRFSAGPVAHSPALLDEPASPHSEPLRVLP